MASIEFDGDSACCRDLRAANLTEVWEMTVFKKQFATADAYEDWLSDASGRINVLAITNAPHVFGTGDRTHSGPVTITYQTNDRSLAPPRSLASKIIQIAIVGALFFAAFLLLVSKL